MVLYFQSSSLNLVYKSMYPQVSTCSPKNPTICLSCEMTTSGESPIFQKVFIYKMSTELP